MEKNKTLLAFQRKLFFNYLCDIRMKNPEEYLSPLEMATWNEVVKGVEYMLEDFEVTTWEGVKDD